MDVGSHVVWLARRGTVVQNLEADVQRVKYILAHPTLYGEPPASLTSSLTPFVPVLQTAATKARQTAGSYASAVMVRGSATAVSTPDPMPQTNDSIPWPSPAPIPSYRILLHDDHSWAVSYPSGDDPTGPLAIQPANATDPGQQWQIPQLHEVAFSLTNVRTRLKATRNQTSDSVLQTTATDNSTLWRFVERTLPFFSPSHVVSPSDPSNCVFETLFVPGDHLNLAGDVRIAGQGLITWNDWTADDHWTLVEVPNPPAPVAHTDFSVDIPTPTAW